MAVGLDCTASPAMYGGTKTRTLVCKRGSKCDGSVMMRFGVCLARASRISTAREEKCVLTAGTTNILSRELYGIDDRLVQDSGKTDLENLKRDEVLLVKGR